jgi:predicted Holliday junction resolvase-like endonuclease
MSPLELVLIIVIATLVMLWTRAEIRVIKRETLLREAEMVLGEVIPTLHSAKAQIEQLQAERDARSA